MRRNMRSHVLLQVQSDEMSRLILELADTKAKLAEAQKDAQRYRWLRDGNDEKGSKAHKIAEKLYGMEWDEAIDKAASAGRE